MMNNLKVILAAMLLSSFAFYSCNEENTSDSSNSETSVNNNEVTQPVDPAIVDNPMTGAEENATNQKLPEIAFAQETFDFGKIKQGEVVNHQFKFKNTGKADLIITSATGSCGCTVPQWPKNPIPPGEEANIDVQFNSAGKSGMQRVNVTLVANTIPNSKVLTITGEVNAPTN